MMQLPAASELQYFDPAQIPRIGGGDKGTQAYADSCAAYSDAVFQRLQPFLNVLAAFGVSSDWHYLTNPVFGPINNKGHSTLFQTEVATIARQVQIMATKLWNVHNLAPSQVEAAVNIKRVLKLTYATYGEAADLANYAATTSDARITASSDPIFIRNGVYVPFGWFDYFASVYVTDESLDMMLGLKEKPVPMGVAVRPMSYLIKFAAPELAAMLPPPPPDPGPFAPQPEVLAYLYAYGCLGRRQMERVKASKFFSDEAMASIEGFRAAMQKRASAAQQSEWDEANAFFASGLAEFRGWLDKTVENMRPWLEGVRTLGLIAQVAQTAAVVVVSTVLAPVTAGAVATAVGGGAVGTAVGASAGSTMVSAMAGKDPSLEGMATSIATAGVADLAPSTFGISRESFNLGSNLISAGSQASLPSTDLREAGQVADGLQDADFSFLDDVTPYEGDPDMSFGINIGGFTANVDTSALGQQVSSALPDIGSLFGSETVETARNLAAAVTVSPSQPAVQSPTTAAQVVSQPAVKYGVPTLLLAAVALYFVFRR